MGVSGLQAAVIQAETAGTASTFSVDPEILLRDGASKGVDRHVRYPIGRGLTLALLTGFPRTAAATSWRAWLETFTPYGVVVPELEVFGIVSPQIAPTPSVFPEFKVRVPTWSWATQYRRELAFELLRNAANRDRSAFLELRPALLKDGKYMGRYVAVIDGKVADSDADDQVLVERLHLKYGDRPMFVGLVTEGDEGGPVTTPF